MRKRKRGRKLSRKSNQRKALLKSLTAAFLLKEKIKTTEAKAKEIAVFAEKQITIAKKSNLAARKLLAGYFSPPIAKKLAKDIGQRYRERKGGYTRIVKLGLRKSDGAKMAIIELVK